MTMRNAWLRTLSMRRVCALPHQTGAQYSAVKYTRDRAAVRNAPTTEAKSVVATHTTRSSTGTPDSANEIDFEKHLDIEARHRRIAIENQQSGSTSLISSDSIFVML